MDPRVKPWDDGGDVVPGDIGSTAAIERRQKQRLKIAPAVRLATKPTPHSVIPGLDPGIHSLALGSLISLQMDAVALNAMPAA
ncbi:hypothetical protein CPT34_08740 [Rhizobium sophoriradicis]|uniref:Uncharacterized protein n=1 Tax=Rhizobium sophoriradicis TaxID=1535245 RepID=A0A2A5KW76_9HYPH|nr:hypothetical protein CPT34_08740 [Rhizobium sophoriradicis]